MIIWLASIRERENSLLHPYVLNKLRILLFPIRPLQLPNEADRPTDCCRSCPDSWGQGWEAATTRENEKSEIRHEHLFSLHTHKILNAFIVLVLRFLLVAVFSKKKKRELLYSIIVIFQDDYLAFRTSRRKTSTSSKASYTFPPHVSTSLKWCVLSLYVLSVAWCFGSQGMKGWRDEKKSKGGKILQPISRKGWVEGWKRKEEDGSKSKKNSWLMLEGTSEEWKDSRIK